MGRYGIRILIALVVIGGLTYMRMQRRADDSKDIRGMMMKALATMPNYKDNEAAIKKMAESAHNEAFNASYTDASRRRDADIDADRYIDKFFHSMIEQAKWKGNQPLVQSLTELRTTFTEPDEPDTGSNG